MTKGVYKHGLKMTGLKAAAGATKSLTGPYGRHRVQLSYNLKTGEVHTALHHQNNWSVYSDKNITTIAWIYTPQTMQDIASLINHDYKVQALKEAN